MKDVYIYTYIVYKTIVKWLDNGLFVTVTLKAVIVDTVHKDLALLAVGILAQASRCVEVRLLLLGNGDGEVFS